MPFRNDGWAVCAFLFLPTFHHALHSAHGKSSRCKLQGWSVTYCPPPSRLQYSNQLGKFKHSTLGFQYGNAGARLTNFYNHPSKLSEIDWAAVAATDFRDAKGKEGKQAEFLMFDVFPWTLIEQIGTINSTMAAKVQVALANVGHQPVVATEPNWYF